MSSSMATDVGQTLHQDPDTRARATRYLQRTGHADLLEMLGLVEAEPVERRGICPACRRPYRAGRWECRHADCERGPAARAVKR